MLATRAKIRAKQCLVSTLFVHRAYKLNSELLVFVGVVLELTLLYFYSSVVGD